MATSGTSNFNPTFDKILQDAAAMVGGGPILADELDSARRGLDYMLTSLQNRAPLLHKIETTVVTASVSQQAYTLDNTIHDVLTATVRTSTTETLLDRHGYERWAELPVKTQTGRPTTYWFDRRLDSGIMNIWPIPNETTTYELVLTVQKTAEDTVRAFNNVDVPRRFLPAVLFGIAYYVGLRRGPRVPTERLQLLKMQYEQELQFAMNEDRERGSFYIRVGRY